MKNTPLKFLFLSLLSLNAFAQGRTVLYEEEEMFKDLPIEEVKEKKDLTLKDETIAYDLNKDTGIKDKYIYTAKDQHKFSGSYSFNTDLTKVAEVSSFEVNYGYKVYYNFWAEAYISQTNGTFSELSENKTENYTTLGSTEARFPRPQNAKESIFSYGLGVGYRFKLAYDFLNLTDFFETINIYYSQHSLNESYRSKVYSGKGFRAVYGIHYRTNTSLFYGGKFSYNHGSVSRGTEGVESKTDASLTVSWTSFGFEMGYYF